MCGIAGAVAWGDREVLARMTEIQRHRGPDDGGVWDTSLSDGTWLGLGARRLAILDLSSAGHMPMHTPDGQYTIVHNGEIYNFAGLRTQLEAKGYRFRSHTDTETILYLYREYGTDCLDKLNGMFAFAIWDSSKRELFLARDHFGVKPLYYTAKARGFAFASEAKALLLLPGFERQLDFTALNQYLGLLWVPDPLTVFRGIYKLPAGHFGILKDGDFRTHQYWDLTFPEAGHTFVKSERDLTAETRDRLFNAVRSQMVSDVPVGAFLSSGLDSSAIVAAMASRSGARVRTYTIAFPDRHRRGETTLDDTAVARRTAAYFGCKHTELVVQPEVADLLQQVVWHMDEPVADPALLAAYLVNREARQDSTVLLSGVGGDEVFAGYRKYRAHYMAQQYRKIPAFLRERFFEPVIDAVPSLRGTRLKGYVRLTKKMTRSASLPPRERFLRDSLYLSDQQRGDLFSSQFLHAVEKYDSCARHAAYFSHVEHADFLNQMLYVDAKTFMVSLNLNYNDKMSMASSVEVRVPFLDRHFAEWVAWNAPPEQKLRQGTSKHILREALKDDLPGEILRQPKAGFGAPIDYWLSSALRELVDDLLSEKQVRERGLFNPPVVSRMVSQHRSGREDWSFQIWQLLTLEIWLRTFFDRSDIALPTHVSWNSAATAR